MKDIKINVDAENGIETKLFLAENGKYSVRVYDLDAQRTFCTVACLSREQAEQVYEDALPLFSER